MPRSRLIRTRLLALLLLLAFASLAPGISSSAVAKDRLSTREKFEVFDEVWKTVNEKYYDETFNGLNWKSVRAYYRPRVAGTANDDDFYGLLKAMVSELRDAHTRVHTPRERRERELLQGVSSGISIFEVEGNPVVVGVAPGSDADRAGVEAGMIVQTIDGKPISNLMSEAINRVGISSSERATRLRMYRRILDGEPGSSFRLGLMRSDGSTFTVSITRRTVSEIPRVIANRLPSGYGYMRLTLWKSPIHKEFKEALENLSDTSGLIIDLRGNPGGEVNEVLRIAGYFFPKRTPFGRFITRSGNSVELQTSSDSKQIYYGPVVVLINEGSGSGSEMFSGVLQETGRAVVVGRQSCGCLLGITRFRRLKGGGEIAVSELGYLSPRGQKLEGGGVTPNETIPLRLADLIHRRDVIVEEAENTLRGALKTSTRVH